MWLIDIETLYQVKYHKTQISLFIVTYNLEGLCIEAITAEWISNRL